MPPKKAGTKQGRAKARRLEALLLSGPYRKECPLCQRVFTHPPAFTVHIKTCGTLAAPPPRRTPAASSKVPRDPNKPPPASTGWRARARAKKAALEAAGLATGVETQQGAAAAACPGGAAKPKAGGSSGAAAGKPVARTKRAGTGRVEFGYEMGGNGAGGKVWTDSHSSGGEHPLSPSRFGGSSGRYTAVGNTPRRPTPDWNTLLSVGAIGELMVSIDERTLTERKSSDWPRRRGEWRRRLLCEPLPALAADTAAAAAAPAVKLKVADLIDSLVELEVALLFSAVLPTWKVNREDWQERVLRCVRATHFPPQLDFGGCL